DPWVNILRGTAACFAAAVGGADIITVRAFNAPRGRPEELGRRIARNTQLIAMEESKLGQVADPGGGAWFSETLASELAEAGWAEFQMLEREGGLTQSLVDGALQGRIQASRAALLDAVAHKQTIVTGVNEFPLLDDYDVPVSPPQTGKPASAPENILASILAGPTASDGSDTEAERLTAMHNGEVFEALRDRAENAASSKGGRPKICVATLGPLAEHSARLDFVRNFFATGGIETIEIVADQNDPTPLERAFNNAGSDIVVLCGADKRYESCAEAVAAQLRSAGAKRVWLAGKFKAPGIDRHIFSGCNAIEELSMALSDLRVA
ncbi:MAG: methylmalonyl-CoA mutase family protein, partial [Henriciella sp.]